MADEREGDGKLQKTSPLEVRVSDAVKQIKQIDRQIDNAPQDSGLIYTLKPPGALNERPQGTRTQRIAFLNRYKDQARDDAWSDVDKETRGIENKPVRDDARETLFPNRFRGINDAARAKARQEDRDLESSQDFMDAERLHKAASRNQPIKTEADGPEQQADKPSVDAERYDRMLRYCNYVEHGKTMTDRTPDME